MSGPARQRAPTSAFIVYTSGTAASPKASSAHRWIVALGDLNRYRLPPQDRDVVLCTGEWVSRVGAQSLFRCARRHWRAARGRATPENILAAIEKTGDGVIRSRRCIAVCWRQRF
jgi:acyl-coenzyme A synthetase/AMP-(fatty) acid ligase